MGYYSVWPYFASMVMLCVMVSTAPFSALDTPPHQTAARVTTLDGLRGYLALSVVFHHVAVFHALLLDGRWDLPPSRFYVMTGQIAVDLFFMVTSYLFWGRLVRAHGRMNWRAFFIGRVFRIGPLYLLAVVIMLAVLFAMTGFVLRVPVWTLIGQIVLWLPLGFTKSRRVNGSTLTTQLLAGVTWTLAYEWVFYLSLPLLALMARRPGWHLRCALLVATAALLNALILGTEPANLILTFTLGALCASLNEAKLSLSVPDAVSSVIVLGLLAAAIVGFDTAYQVGVAILVGLVFYCVTSGCSVFGLLTSRAGRRLGNISYGLYLLQGLTLNAFFLPAPLRALALNSPAEHWGVALCASATLVVCAGIAHCAVERPGIRLGQILARR